jgi:hypothetical protein
MMSINLETLQRVSRLSKELEHSCYGGELDLQPNLLEQLLDNYGTNENVESIRAG